MTDHRVIHCEKLCKSYQIGPETLPILKDLDLSVNAGELVSVMGASGAGKSTLLHLLGGLDDPDSGRVTVDGVAMAGLNETRRARLRNRSLGFVYQFHHLLPEFSAIENTFMPLLLRKVSRDEARQQALEILQRVGLGDRIDHRPAELSGGERQRVAVARALVGKPSCVLMDEPTGNLDKGSAHSVLDTILELNESTGISMVLVTHDSAVSGLMHRHLLLENGALSERATTESAIANSAPTES